MCSTVIMFSSVSLWELALVQSFIVAVFLQWSLCIAICSYQSIVVQAPVSTITGITGLVVYLASSCQKLLSS